jgi:large subunit ribosomal protein L28
MPRCDLTDKGPSWGNNVSHAKNHTRRRWDANVHKHRLYVPELGEYVTLKLSTKALRTINKKGLLRAMRDEGIKFTIEK